MEKIVILAIPMYFGSLLLEAWYSARKKKGYFKLKDSLGNLGTGIIMQMIEIFTKPTLLAGFAYLSSQYNLSKALGLNLWSDDITTLHGAVSWVVVFLLTDLVYYFFHRHSHEVNFLWAAHVVHHSSEEYNYSVALRQSALQGLWFTIYLALLFVLGLPAPMVLGCYGLNLIYQFFLHTRFIGKLGPLELIFNTPSHHRVHHARQEKYLDRNYAGTLIIWDRMFGTFMEEAEEPRYGVYPRFQSYDPVKANVMPVVELLNYMNAARGMDKCRVLLKGPLWLFEKFKKGKSLNILDSERPVDSPVWIYFSLALTLALTVLFIPSMPFKLKSGLTLMLLAFLWLMGLRLDRGPGTQ